MADSLYNLRALARGTAELQVKLKPVTQDILNHFRARVRLVSAKAEESGKDPEELGVEVIAVVVSEIKTLLIDGLKDSPRIKLPRPKNNRL